MKLLNIENWHRKASYLFFKDYNDPFFNVTFNVDISLLKSYCTKENLTFNFAFLHQLICCTNVLPNFKLRIFNEEIYSFDTIDVGTAILKENTSFVFCYFPFMESLHDFISIAKQQIKKQSASLIFGTEENRLDLIHTSILPWISFTGIKHARKGDEHTKGIPKFMIGKIFEQNGKLLIPLNIEVHHGLMDGYHVGEFVRLLEEKLAKF